jgi:hypothetical protein
MNAGDPTRSQAMRKLMLGLPDRCDDKDLLVALEQGLSSFGTGMQAWGRGDDGIA